jgi:hypothetical protein
VIRRGLVLVWAVGCLACGGSDRPPGQVEGPARSPSILEDQAARLGRARSELADRANTTRELPAKQILFGDLHVHTTYSVDAFLMELPGLGLQGIHTPADACDFARHCAAVDFFSFNDHAETFTPEHWTETKHVTRRCNAMAGSPEDQDLIVFAGWEWTQSGITPETHWGHKNVIFAGLEDHELPARPISSLPDDDPGLIVKNARRTLGLRWFNPTGWRDYADLAWLLDRLEAIPRCPKGVDTRELPPDCHENAATPAELYEKLRQWGFETLVIPHGNTWGIYTPPLASWDKALDPLQHDPEKQRLLEIMSGHGNSEEYRSWSPAEEKSGEIVCPEPTPDFLPCCWQAGEIMRKRCGDLADEECEARVLEARRLALQANVAPRHVFPDSEPEEWLDCDQCRDCFKPAFNFRPRESSQYAMALSNFSERDDDGRPLRFRFGFIASTDDHTARPGTGYKQYERRKMTFSTGVASPLVGSLVRQSMEDPRRPQSVDVASRSVDGERVMSFTFPGGIVAAHAEGRGREAVWAALERREVYGTSGPRILLWFDLLNGPDGRTPMGSEVVLSKRPRFEVRAAGAFEQKPGCPDASVGALSPERLEYLCAGQCYNPSDERHAIVAIEVVRIRPQASPGERLEGLIEDPWRRFDCPSDPGGCVIEFEDEEFPESGRDILYYARALQEQTPAINGDTLRTEFDANGNAIRTNPCYGDYRTPLDDDCLAPAQERAWSSPIFVNQPRPSGK